MESGNERKETLEGSTDHLFSPSLSLFLSLFFDLPPSRISICSVATGKPNTPNAPRRMMDSMPRDTGLLMLGEEEVEGPAQWSTFCRGFDTSFLVSLSPPFTFDYLGEKSDGVTENNSFFYEYPTVMLEDCLCWLASGRNEESIYGIRAKMLDSLTAVDFIFFPSWFFIFDHSVP